MRVVVRSRDAAGTHFGGAFWPFGQSVRVDVDAPLLAALRSHPFLTVLEIGDEEPSPPPAQAPVEVAMSDVATVTHIGKRRR